MDISTIVAWIQAAIWLVVGVSYISKIRRGKAGMPKLPYGKLMGYGIAFGFILSAVSLWLALDRVPRYQRHVKFQVIAGQTFKNEKVKLDGKEFLNCNFEDVTIVYDGRYPVRMVGNRFQGSLDFTSDNPSIDVAVGILSALGFMHGVQKYSDEPLGIRKQGSAELRR